MMQKRISLALVATAIAGVLLLGVVVPGAAPTAEAQVQDGDCPSGFALLDDGVTCEAGPVATETQLFCSSGLLRTLDNGAQLCTIAARLVPGTDCPPGFAPDDSLGGTCARFQRAEQLPPACPAGARGEVPDCYVRVAKGPRGTLVCEAGTLAGDICVVEGEPPTRSPGVCPTGRDIVQDGCYRLVSREAVTLECPEIATEIDGECRVAVALIPGGLQCETGYGLVGGRCIAQSAADVPEAICPEGSVEDDEGLCRKPVAAARGVYFCADERAALNGISCVFTAPFIRADRLVCSAGQAALIASLGECLIGPLSQRRVVTCNDGIVDVELQTCVFLPNGGECPGGAILTGEGTCAFASETTTVFACNVGQSYLPSAQGLPGCVAPARSTSQDCPDGYQTDPTFGDVCTRVDPALQTAEGADFCENLDAFLTASSCLLFAPFEQTPACGEGALIDDTGLCLLGPAQLDERVGCARDGVILDQRGFCTFALEYATVEITKVVEGDGPEEVFLMVVRDFEGTQELLIAPGETVSATVLVGAVSVFERTPVGWRLRDITCGETELAPAFGDQHARFSVSAGQRVQCVATNVPAAATLTLDIEIDSDDGESIPDTFGVRAEVSGQQSQDLVLAQGSPITVDVVAGYVSVVTDFPLGWQMTDVSCDSVFTSLASYLFRVTVAPAQSVSCSLRAAPTGIATVTITKEIGEGGDASVPSDFEIENLADGSRQSFRVLPGAVARLETNPGAFRIREIPRSGTEFVGAECQARLLDDAVEIVRSSQPWSVAVGAQADRQIDCVFRSRDVEVAELRFAQPVDGQALWVGVAAVIGEQIPTRFDAPGSPAGPSRVRELNPGDWAIFIEPAPGLRVDAVDCSATVVDPFNGERTVVRFEAGEVVSCSVTRSEVADAPTITLVRELDGRDAAPESGFVSVDEIVIRQGTQLSTPQLGSSLTVAAIPGYTALVVANEPGWQRARISCVDATGSSIAQGLEFVGLRLFAGDQATCTVTSRLLEQSTGADRVPIVTATPTPTVTPAPTTTPTPTATPTPTTTPQPTPTAADYATAAISYPANGFSLTPIPSPDEVRQVVVPAATSAPLVATGSNAAPLVAVALGLLGIGSCLHVAARRADE